MKEIALTLTGEYRVDKINYKSKARYVKGIVVGDIIKFSLDIVDTTGASRGNYALYIDIYVNGELLANVSQNEVTNMPNIFDLTPIGCNNNKESVCENEQ